MQDSDADPTPWSDRLALALASSLGDAAPSTEARPSAQDPLRDWAARTRNDPEARRALFALWRKSHPSLLRDLDDHAPEVLAEELDALLQDWCLQDLLLLLLSEPLDDGWELAHFFVRALPSLERREQAEAILSDWSQPPAPGSAVRVLVVGGIDREARTQLERLQAQGRTGLDWIPVSRGKGRGFNREVLSRVQQAQALVLVTGRVSHVLAQTARAEAEAHGVRVYYLERASGRQLDEVLARIDGEFG